MPRDPRRIQIRSLWVVFFTGVVVGIACTLLAVIVIGPSRRVRAESKMALETQMRLLLGMRDDETAEHRVIESSDTTPTAFDTAQFAALTDLGDAEGASEAPRGSA